MKLLAKYLIATSLALFLVGLLAAFGNRQLGLSPSSISNFSAYPLPGTPTPRGSGPIASPTRLAAYPLPGAKPPTYQPRAPGATLSFTPVSTSYLPLILQAVGAKGTAGTNFYFPPSALLSYSNALTMGVNWRYEWFQVFLTSYHPFVGSNQTEYDLGYQVVNDVRSQPGVVWDIHIENCPGNSTDPYTRDLSIIMSPTIQAARQACIADLAHTRPGMSWMIWNEPDLCGTDSDCFSPLVGAQYFKTISDTIVGADPSARLIVGNMGSQYRAVDCDKHYPCNVNWLTSFITNYQTLYGVSPTPTIAGYGFHAYANNDISGLGFSPCVPTGEDDSAQGLDQCLTDRFTAIITASAGWVNTNDPGKERWITEMNWALPGEKWDTFSVQTRRMPLLCNAAQQLAVTRYAWFYGEPWYDAASKTEALLNPDGTLSVMGQTFIGCPN